MLVVVGFFEEKVGVGVDKEINVKFRCCFLGCLDVFDLICFGMEVFVIDYLVFKIDVYCIYFYCLCNIVCNISGFDCIVVFEI